jgi:hypothetical protein
MTQILFRSVGPYDLMDLFDWPIGLQYNSTCLRVHKYTDCSQQSLLGDLGRHCHLPTMEKKTKNIKTNVLLEALQKTVAEHTGLVNVMN